jgi:hypothetical protein
MEIGAFEDLIGGTRKGNGFWGWDMLSQFCRCWDELAHDIVRDEQRYTRQEAGYGAVREDALQEQAVKEEMTC